MDLIEINENWEVKIDPHAMNIESIRTLVKRDKGMAGDATGRHKLKSRKELSYVYFMFNPKSQYARNEPNETARHQKVKSELDLPEDWEPDKYVKSVIDTYKEAIEDPLTRLWRAGNHGIDKLQQYLNNVNLEDGEIGIKEYVGALEKLDVVSKQIDALEKKIKEREQADTKTYAGVEQTEFNE